MNNKSFLTARLTLAFLMIAGAALANEENFFKSDTIGKEGVIIRGSKFSKQFSVIMRDTTLSGNRFDYRWHAGLDSNGVISSKNYLFRPYILDSALSLRIDSMLLNGTHNVSVKITSYPKQDAAKLAKNFIRLYSGYIDDKGNLNVVVQFVTPKDFKRDKPIYSKQLFLVVPRRELHFAVVQLKAGEYE